ncbi:MAG: hypothetical protein ACPG77_11830, partial [Nannocystaceae bacterium]
MQLTLPKFLYRFIPSMGNVIHPGNFHPVGTQRGAEALVSRALATGQAAAGEGGRWLLVGGSGGFGSAARIALGATHGAHTLDVSFDAPPKPESRNKMRRVGSPGFHRTLAMERRLRALGRIAESFAGDAFARETREKAVVQIRELFPEGKIDGLVWSLAAPRAVNPRTGKPVASALKPLGNPLQLKTFSRAIPEQPSEVSSCELPPGTPEEAIATIFVMGGQVVQAWIDTLIEADVLAEGFTLLTISYRGGPLNAGIYRKGLIGLAKADLEFHTAAIHHQLQAKLGGRALAVEGPAVVTEASGGIPGVPFYMAHLLDVLGDRHHDPLTAMQRLFGECLPKGGEPVVDEEGLIRLDAHELADDVQEALRARHEACKVGDAFPTALYDS